MALFVHRRADLLPRTLDCLRVSGLTELYVFSDGPRDAGDIPGVEKVREVIAGIDWIDPVVVARAENLGLSESIREGLDELFANHDAAVVIEDDVCVAPEFYDYACRALRHYRDEPSVAGITGLRLPFSRRALGSYPFDVFMSLRFHAWGWATWRDRWQSFSFDLDALRREVAAAPDFHPARAGYDLPIMIDQTLNAPTLGGSWDVACGINMLLHGQYFVTPTWNMVENSGFWEGTHYRSPPPWQLVWEQDLRPAGGSIRFAPPEECAPILRDYKRFHAPTLAQHVRGKTGAAIKLLRGTPVHRPQHR